MINRYKPLFEENYKIKNISQDKDGYVKMGDYYMQPEDTKEYLSGNLIDYAKNKIIDKAKKDDLSGLNSQSEYYIDLFKDLGIKFDILKFRNKIAKKYLKTKTYKSDFVLGN